jgi:hypothetical protein
MTRKYETRSLTIESLLSWVKSGEIAIPEIQRPFVWSSTQVRDFLDSLYHDYPVGYIITWKNPDVITRDGKRSNGKRILIDGQQRVTALMAALLGHTVINKHYKSVRIRIAFHLLEQRFDVWDQAIRRNPLWIEDISVLFVGDLKMHRIAADYAAKNPDVSTDIVYERLAQLHRIINNPIGIIELDASLDIDTVAEIFIRINSKGTPLNQADFAMSKMSVNERYGGDKMRRAIDYFCHMAVSPDFYRTIEANDPHFTQTEYFRQMAWLSRDKNDLYDPNYSDMLRVAFVSEFERGQMEELVALLSGRNFETRQYEEAVIATTFERLDRSLMDFMNETHFKRLINIVSSAGFISPRLISSKMNVNFAYIAVLWMRRQGISSNVIERQVRRWFVFSVLTSRYTSGFETQMAQDLANMKRLGAEAFMDDVIASRLSDSFWTSELPRNLESSNVNNPAFHTFCAAQVKFGDHGFLSRDIRVYDLLSASSLELHHIFPKALLKREGYSEQQHNQVANYAIIQSDINVAISDKSPSEYLRRVRDQIQTDRPTVGNITDAALLQRNLEQHCIPPEIFEMTARDYPEFLKMRRHLIAQKIRDYFFSL